MGHPEDQNTGHIDEREEVARGQEVAIMRGWKHHTRAGTVCGTRSGTLLGCGKGGKPGLTRETQNASHVAQWQSACLASMREDQSSIPSMPNKTKMEDQRCRLCVPQFPMPQFP